MQYKIKLTLSDSILINSAYPLLSLMFGNDEINALQQEVEEISNFLTGDYITLDFKSQLPDKQTENIICKYYLSGDDLDDYSENAELKKLYYETSYITSIIEVRLEGDINVVNDIKQKLGLNKANIEVDYINVANLYKHPYLKAGDKFQELIYIPQFKKMDKLTSQLNKAAQSLIKDNDVKG